MYKSYLFFFLAIICGVSIKAQLANGAPALDFSVTDLNGNSWSLYGEMAGGRSACLDFSATWCGPCWSFHNSQVLKSVVNNLSSYTSVLFMEADFGTNTNCLYNLSPCTKGTQGNWVAGTNYPIADLSASNGAGVAGAYNVNFVPTLYVISPDFRVWNIISRSYQEYSDWITKSFTLAATEAIQHSLCGDNGSITLAVTGGLGTKTYKWSNGANTKDLKNIPGGTYNVTITDAQGYFKSYGPFIVDGPQKRVAITSIQKVDNKCFGNNKGSIKLNVAFGTPGYMYQWSNGETGSQINNLTVGTYTVTVLDANNCSIVAAYYVSEPPLLTALLTGVNETCDNSNGFISIFANGGTTPYTYWLGNKKSTVGSFNNLKEGTHIIKVIDLNNCETQESITLTASHKPKLEINSTGAITCVSDTIHILGDNSDSGNGFITEWTSRNGKIIGDKFNLNIKTAKAGTYQLKITNTLNSCIKIDSVIIKEDKKFPDIKVLNGSDLNCYIPEIELIGESVDKQTHLFWTKLNSNFKEKKDKVLISEGGSYVFNVQDTINQCVSKDTVVIKADKNVPFISIENPNLINCKVLSTIIDAKQSESNSNIELKWITNDGNIVADAKTLHPLVDKSGTYVLKLKNIINGCESNQAVVVNENKELADVKLNELIQDISCIRPILKINTNLSNDYTILWTTSNGNIINGSDQSKVELDREGSYNLEYQHKISLCDKSIDFSIREQKALLPAYDLVQEEHIVRCVDKTSGIVVKRNWNFGDGSTSIETNPIHTYAQSGEYQICLEVENECGLKSICKNISIALQGVLNLASWELRPVSCNGGADAFIKLNVQGGKLPYNFEWNTGSKEREVNDLKAGTYSVIITDALGAKIEKTFIVKEPSQLREESLDLKHENAGFKNGSIKIKVGGGIPGYQYLWSNGSTSDEINNLEAGTYSVKVFDANSCEFTFGPYEVKALTATTDLSEKFSIILEPNPVSDHGRIIIHSQNLISNSILNILDPIGRMIKTQTINKGTQVVEMDMNSFESGVYMIQLTTERSQISKLWIKE